jgi:hypothetical protein
MEQSEEPKASEKASEQKEDDDNMKAVAEAAVTEREEAIFTDLGVINIIKQVLIRDKLKNLSAEANRVTPFLGMGGKLTHKMDVEAQTEEQLQVWRVLSDKVAKATAQIDDPEYEGDASDDSL